MTEQRTTLRSLRAIDDNNGSHWKHILIDIFLVDTIELLRMRSIKPAVGQCYVWDMDLLGMFRKTSQTRKSYQVYIFVKQIFQLVVRSTTTDKWKDIELQKMIVGGNKKARNFLCSQSDWNSKAPIPERYNTKAAALYRDKISTEAQGKTWSLESSSANNHVTSLIPRSTRSTACTASISKSRAESHSQNWDSNEWKVGGVSGAHTPIQTVASNDVNRCSTPLKLSHLNPSPEIMFLIREHAKTVANIKSITRRLQEIELKVDNIQRSINDKNHIYSVAEPKSKGDHCAVNVLSDDSGGEYSRTTTGTTTDEDELLSLLDQIAKCSHHIQQTQQAHLYQNQMLSSTLLSRSYQHSAGSMPGLYSSSVPSMSQQTMPHSQLQKQQSLSALLFEPSVERFLSNVDLLVDDDKPSHSTAMDTIAASQTMVPQSDIAINRQIERARHLVTRKEQEGIKTQMKLADDWYASHSRDRTHQQASHSKAGSRVDPRFLETFEQGYRL
ncbi:ADP-ribosylation factor GTPase-activating protein 1-like protein [Leptotrombidium deliense]|uniref:ADP-ribosylation factor GTPase-activating protein 1-like protein n=1 Tax=Leptotrombidium deliense TaxID=299467 RepID=A0A443SIA3_9ACAR|nr:ADP-ribosylation factor GTPase-activating protein 1-like protein [Leptotrombidium deliense]